MSKIIIDTNAVLNLSFEVDRKVSKLEEVEQFIKRLHHNLDSQIRDRRDIEHRITTLNNSIANLENGIKEFKNFLNTSATNYETAERDVLKLAEQLMDFKGGVGSYSDVNNSKLFDLIKNLGKDGLKFGVDLAKDIYIADSIYWDILTGNFDLEKEVNKIKAIHADAKNVYSEIMNDIKPDGKYYSEYMKIKSNIGVIKNIAKPILIQVLPQLSAVDLMVKIMGIKNGDYVWKEISKGPYEKGLFKGKYNLSAGKVVVSGWSPEFEWVKTYDKNNPKGVWENPKIELSKSIKASLVELNFDGKYENKNMPVFGEGNVSIGKAEVEEFAGVDLRKLRAGVGVEAKVAGVQGEVKGGFEVLGYKIGLKAEGNVLSAGGEAKFDLDFLDENKDGKIFESGVGVSLGAGASVGLSIEKA